MRLTTFTDYSLRVLIYLAAHAEGRATVNDVAAGFGISRHHVAKVIHFLGAAGWVQNARGRRGGARLAVAPSAINVAEVVRLAEGGDAPAECFVPGAPRCAIAPECRLARLFAEAVEDFYASLARRTLADLVADRAAIVQLLRPPRVSAKGGDVE